MEGCLIVMELMGAGCLTDILDEFRNGVQMTDVEIALVCYDVSLPSCFVCSLSSSQFELSVYR